MRENIFTENAPAPIGPYSQAVKASGVMLFVSGQIPYTPAGELAAEDIAGQTRQVLHNVEAVLAAAGFGLDHVVKTSVFLQDLNDFEAMNTVYAEFFGAVKPARAAVEVARLPKDVKVEIEAIAIQ